MRKKRPIVKSKAYARSRYEAGQAAKKKKATPKKQGKTSKSTSPNASSPQKDATAGESEPPREFKSPRLRESQKEGKKEVNYKE